MNIMPMGDYYLWYCDWCDSANRTIWTRFEKNDITCSVCQRSFSTVENSRSPRDFQVAQQQYGL